MKEKIAQLKGTVLELVEKSTTAKELGELKVRFLGKSGEVTGLLRGMRDLPADERPAAGKMVNDLRVEIEDAIGAKESTLKKKEMEARFESEALDVTLPAKERERGNLHPIHIVEKQVLNALMGMGFEVFEGPEIETDYYCFQALNIPKDHPARDMQDTFYVGENVVLRPHTSPGQIHVMENKQPPIKILSPGKVYRSDDDATHSPMFHQIEGLVVDKGITLCDLKGMLDEFVKKIFDSSTETRLRPSYFPFTEPSVEVDVTCSECHGKGCRLCKGTGWIEILGAGMVNRHVLENCNVDPDVYSGFAFGLGIERVTMIKYGIPDMRLLFESDVRFLKQFRGR